MTQRDEDRFMERKKSPEEIEAEITQARSVITEDIRALGERLSPENLKENARGMMRDAKDAAVDTLRQAKDNAVESVTEAVHELSGQARRAGTATAGFVTANAIPLALIGIGVGWLTMTMRRQRTMSAGYGGYDQSTGYDQSYNYGRGYGYGREFGGQEGLGYDETYGRGGYEGQALGGYEAEGQGGSGLMERGRGMIEHGRERMHDLAGRANQGMEQARMRVRDQAAGLQHRASELSQEARHRLHDAQLRTREYAHENPLAVGAVAIAAGIGVGMLLPSSQAESRLMAPAKQRLQGVVGDTRDAAQRIGRAAKDAVTDVKNAVGQQQNQNLSH